MNYGQNTGNKGTGNNNSEYLFTWDDVKDSEHENDAKNNPELFKFITEELGIKGWEKVIVRKIEDNTKIIVYNTETEDLLTFRLGEGRIIGDFNNENICRYVSILEEGKIKIYNESKEKIESNKVVPMKKILSKISEKNKELLTKVLWFVGMLIIFLPVAFVLLYEVLIRGTSTIAEGIIYLIMLLFMWSAIVFYTENKIPKIETELKKFYNSLHVLSQQKLINLSENCVNYWCNDLLNKTKKQVDIWIIYILLIILVWLMSLIFSLSSHSLSLFSSFLSFFLLLVPFFLMMYVYMKFTYFLFIIKRLSKIQKLPLDMPKYLNDTKGNLNIIKILDLVPPVFTSLTTILIMFYFLIVLYLLSIFFFFFPLFQIELESPFVSLIPLLPYIIFIAIILITILYLFIGIESLYTIRKGNERQKAIKFLFKEIYFNDAIRKAAENPTCENIEYTKHLEEAISILETKTNRLKMWEERLKDIAEILGNLKLIITIIVFMFIVLGVILFPHFDISNLLINHLSQLLSQIK